jgi:hypothetical protein
MVGLIIASVANVTPMFSGTELLIAIVAVFVMFLVGGVLGWIGAKALRLKDRDFSVGWLSVFFMNNVFIGYPLVEAVFGSDALFCASLSTIPFNVFIFTVGVAFLQGGPGKGKIHLREIISPPMIATFLAIVIFLTQVPVPELVVDTLSSLGAATVPVSMLIIGTSLSQVPLKDAFTDWRAYAISLVRLILCPVVSWLVLGLFLPQGSMVLGVFVLIAACPSAAMITILSVRFGVDETLATRVNFISTILSAVTLPIMASLLL